MRPSISYALFALLASSSPVAANTIENFTFAGNANAGITGTIIFQLEADGTAGLSDVLSANASAGPTNFTFANLTSFSFYPSPDGCADVMAALPGVGREFPPTDTCDFIITSFEIPGGADLAMEVEFDPAIGNVNAAATYSPVSTMGGFHGGLTNYTVTSAVSPEPSTLACLAAGALALAGVRRKKKVGGTTSAKPQGGAGDTVPQRK